MVILVVGEGAWRKFSIVIMDLHGLEFNPVIKSIYFLVMELILLRNGIPYEVIAIQVQIGSSAFWNS